MTEKILDLHGDLADANAFLARFIQGAGELDIPDGKWKELDTACFLVDQANKLVEKALSVLAEDFRKARENSLEDNDRWSVQVDGFIYDPRA